MNSNLIVLKVMALLLIAGVTGAAQNNPAEDPSIQEALEAAAEYGNESADYTVLAEHLAYLRKHPVDLNDAARSELAELGFLSPLQVNALLSHRSEHGAFIDLLELQGLDGFGLDVIRLMLPFIALHPVNPLSKLTLGKMITHGEHEMLMSYGRIVERQQGYLRNDSGVSAYPGSPARLSVRYRYKYGNLLGVSMTMEKDPGEEFFSGKQHAGFDFYSGNIFVRQNHTKIVLGDYSLQFGQGLSLWSGTSFGKGGAISTIPRQGTGLKPYSSAGEVLFFRGAATSVSWKRFGVTTFISSRNEDAEVEGENKEVSTISKTGLHRTGTETDRKGMLTHRLTGVNLVYAAPHFSIGVINYYTRFNHSIAAGNYQYSKYAFSGNSLVNNGFYFQCNWRNTYFFGEAAQSDPGGGAGVCGAIASLSPGIAMVVLYRNYQEDFHSFFNQAVSEASTAVNEKGLYEGLSISLNRNLELQAYTDYFKFPWLRYRVDGPSQGYEQFVQLNYNYKKSLKISFRYRNRKKEENGDENTPVTFLQPVEKRNCRLEADLQLARNLEIRNRVEWVRYAKGPATAESGYLMFQDLVAAPAGSRFSGNMRFAVFDTPSFNSRVYAYENDILYGYSVPAFQNSGTRFYINLRFRLSRHVDVWFRYAVTRYTHLDEIGSGMDRITGNRKQDFKVQCRFAL
ncbi:helix-hairpin-helix domain-containing protein [Hufsiella ginkgonis]|uniref:Helix-hairpin-helix domain-containing protein n=1 Tax=Hufsiella ginkgonis TaxID=2695274 RepID=A0A7K1XX69_9SPHI|nr:helix-hairpin-helix domain-containing protein [Hufsiella ginkgonis]MXV15532.1 helix-hairpin-helix domain-containing protein [Hufsiella ginkgonis]